MPIEKRINDEGELVDRYVVPAVIRVTEVTQEQLEIVKSHRRFYAGQIEVLNRQQKECAAEKNYEAAKAHKDVIKHFQQAEKCATLVINYFERSTKLTTVDFPMELYDLLDYEFNSIEFQSEVA